jgi:hypothetical protein
MLKKDFQPITFAARELIAELKSGPMVPLMATKQLLDEGNEAGAYSCLREMADEH